MLRSSREAVDGFLRTAFVIRDRYTTDRGEVTAEVRSIEVRVSREPTTVSSLLVVVLRSGKRDRFVVERQESAASVKNKTIKKVGIYFPEAELFRKQNCFFEKFRFVVDSTFNND